MGLSFLTPAFLAGLIALAVPVIVHLTHRQRSEAVPFPSLMFLSRIPYRTTRRQRIRHWLLFLLRSVAILLLVAAFARPLIEDRAAVAAANRAAREVVVLLDRSHSMSHGDRWGRGRAAARRILESLGPDDRASLVFFAHETETASEPTGDVGRLIALLGSTAPGGGTTRYAPALRFAGEILERSDRPRRDMVLITDFQRTGWSGGADVTLPEGVELTTVDVSGPDEGNLAVVGADIARRQDGNRDLAFISARVVNFGGEAATDVEVELTVEGEVSETQEVTIEPGGSVGLDFGPVIVTRRMSAAIRAGSDPLPADNSLRLVLEPEAPLAVLVIEPADASTQHGLYLRRALDIGNLPPLTVTVRRGAALSPEVLGSQSVVVLNDAPLPPGAAPRGLRRFVEEGGGLWLILGRRSAARGGLGELLGDLRISVGQPIDRTDRGGATLSSIDHDHPVFEVFRTPRSGDFTTARFYRYRETADGDSARVLAEFDDGSAALIERRVGEGRVLIWMSGLGNFWNDLAVQPVFLPFVNRTVRYLADYVEPQPWFRVGQVVDLHGSLERAGANLDGETELVVEPPSGEPSTFRLEEHTRLLELEEPGFYRVRRLGDREATWFLAANLDPEESRLDRIDPEELAGSIGSAGGGERAAVARGFERSREERERRQALWWYLLLVAGTILLMETLISNYASRQRGRGDGRGRTHAPIEQRTR